MVKWLAMHVARPLVRAVAAVLIVALVDQGLIDGRLLDAARVVPVHASRLFGW